MAFAAARRTLSAPRATNSGGPWGSNGTPREHARWDATPRDASMPSLMPSLLKYFTVVGGLLFAALIGMNALMEQGGPGPRLVKDTPKVVVQIDPHASKVERLRAQEAALKAAEKADPAAHPVVVPEPRRLPREPGAQPVEQPQPVTQVAAKPVQAAQPMSSMPAA